MALGIKKREGVGMDMYTLLYLKWMTNKDLLWIARGTLLKVVWQPGWEGRAWGRMDTCTCVAESLLCSPKTITTLFVNWLYPNTK